MQVVKHTAELAQLVVGAGGVGALVDYCRESSGNNRLPATMALGYVAAFSETLALSVIAGAPTGAGRTHRLAGSLWWCLVAVCCRCHGLVPVGARVDKAAREAAIRGCCCRLSSCAERGLPPLVACLAEEAEDHLRAATAWTLGQIGRHTSDHARAVADTGVPLGCANGPALASALLCTAPSPSSPCA